MTTWLGPRDIEMMARVLLGFLLGGVLGYERARIGRLAGPRTYMLVCAGAARLTLAGIFDLASAASPIRDPMRIAAQIVSGVGFLGAGIPRRTSPTVRRLVSATSIWLVAAIGMLVRMGQYSNAIFTTVVGYLAPRICRAAPR
ncbi:MAG: MgtC/SapB family protein [Chloroflexi bacterium]|nr:MgtC/SapB family protein [Chloroflexota bacterium]